MTPFVLALLIACGGADAPAPTTETPAASAEAVGAVHNVNVDTLAADLEGGKVAMLVDVRTAQEFAEGHVPGAVNIPLDELPKRVSELEAHKDAGLYVVCRSGGRSASAASMLAGRGFQANNVEGGTLAWTGSGRPTE